MCLTPGESGEHEGDPPALVDPRMQGTSAHQTSTHRGDREGGGSAPPGAHLAVSGDSGSHRRGVLLAPSVSRPGTLLNIPQGTQPPPTPKEYLAPNVSSARLRKPDSTKHPSTTVTRANKRDPDPGETCQGQDPVRKVRESVLQSRSEGRERR